MREVWFRMLAEYGGNYGKWHLALSKDISSTIQLSACSRADCNPAYAEFLLDKAVPESRKCKRCLKAIGEVRAI